MEPNAAPSNDEETKDAQCQRVDQYKEEEDAVWYTTTIGIG
jgi:hypothetical protein